MTELQTLIWLEGNIDRKSPLQISTTPQDYETQEEVDEDRISKMPDDVLCFQVKIGCYSVHILKHLCGEETSRIPNDEEPSCDGLSRLANHTFSHMGKHYPWSCIDRYGWKIQGQ